MANQHHRIYTYDLLRGLAVLTMMLAHSVYFFHSRDSRALLVIENIGNTVSFVTFLLVSGAVTIFGLMPGHHETSSRKRRSITRVMLLLLAYYLLAVVLSGQAVLRAEGFARIRLLLDILSFRYLPGFTEYFPPFIFYSAMVVLVPKFFVVASRRLVNVILISAVALLGGWALYQLPVGTALRPWVALVAGAEGMFRFPLLQYLPVFLLGLYWGHKTLSLPDVPAKRSLSFQFGIFFALLAGAAWAAARALDWALPTVFSRWPPSVPFLALGLAFAFLAGGIFYAVHQLRHVKFLRDLLLMFGQNALGLFWSHIFLLGLYATAHGPQVSSPGFWLALFILLVVMSVALTTFLPFNFRLALTSIRGSREEQEEALAGEAVFKLSQDVAAEAAVATGGLRRYFFPGRQAGGRRGLRRRHRIGISLIFVASAAFIFPATTQEIAIQRQQQGADVWWSKDYGYREQMSVQNTDTFVTIKAGTPVSLPFNHKKLVQEGKSRADGLDVKVVYWTGDQHIVAQSYVDHPNSGDAALKFRAPVDIQAGKLEEFYSLYYGGFVSVRPPVVSLDTHDALRASFDLEEHYSVLASVSKSWNLIGTEDGNTVSFHVTTRSRSESQSMTYQVLDTDLTGEMVHSVDTSWDTVIPVEKLKPGAYRIQATLHDGQKVETSQETGFFRSYPLYVAWTIDWEGYDSNQAYMDAMEAIATEYNLPMTHFFNPRIYTTKTISAARAQTLTTWVKRRIGLGDGYGLHLHMFTDFVEQAGVTPRTEPNWGDNGSGYGVALGGYTREEQQQIIRSGVNRLIEHGFDKPVIFRAGGWYANLDTLTALENIGFRSDSSARTSYQFGRNKLPGYWAIPATMRPFYPSRTNQNRTGTNNTFSVLEIPDNGADSYAFSAEAMINRFRSNIGNGVMTDKQQLTYLTHPHWFDEKEQARVRDTLTYVSRYNSADDQGPVIFTTTNDILKIWTNDQ